MRMGDYTIQLIDPWVNVPLLALLIVLTVSMYFLMVFTRKKRLTRFGNIKTLERIHGFRRFYISPTILIAKILIVTLLFFVATDTIDISMQAPATDSDYVVIIDASPSMALDDFNPSRIAAARDISQDWIRAAPDGVAIGLIVFSDAVVTEIPLSYDKNRLRDAIAETAIDYSRAGTAINEALLRSVELLRETQRNRTVLLLTDGFDSVSNTTLAQLEEFNIRVDSFGIGDDQTLAFLARDEELVEFDDFAEFFDSLDLNFERLEELSDATGGQAYSASDVQELRAVFSEATLDTSQIPIDARIYIVLLIALLSIAEFLLYSRFGGL